MEISAKAYTSPPLPFEKKINNKILYDFKPTQKIGAKFYLQQLVKLIEVITETYFLYIEFRRFIHICS